MLLDASVLNKIFDIQVAGKQAAFAALSQYFQSQVCAQKKQVGEQIARLNYCLELLKQSQQRAGNPTYFDDYVKKANRLLAEAKKDNDFIYHERVPESSVLQPIDKVASARLAKPLPIPERFSSNFKDLYERNSKAKTYPDFFYDKLFNLRFCTL